MEQVQFHRRGPRVITEAWPARYFDEEDPGAGVRDCRIMDISLLGVGLEVFGDMSEDVIGHRLEIYVHAPVGYSVSLRFVGRVRYLSEGRLGGTRAGVEFEGLSDAELDILKVLALPTAAGEG